MAGRPTQSECRATCAARIVSHAAATLCDMFAILTTSPCRRLTNVWDDTAVGASTTTRSTSFRPTSKVSRALHPDDHRPRRPRARPDLRLRHHRLRRRAVGPALDHHRHLAASRWRWPAPGSWARAIPTTCSPTRQKASARRPRSRARAPSSQPTHGDIRQGFVYERVPHITLKSIANNAEIDVIWEKWQADAGAAARAAEQSARASPGRNGRSRARPTTGGRPRRKKLHADWWEARIARQKEIDASIAAKAEFEYLYDKPYEDNEARPRRRAVHGREPVAAPRARRGRERRADRRRCAKHADGYGEERSFVQMILENLKTAGVQQAHKEDRITFTALTPWPGDTGLRRRPLSSRATPSPAARSAPPSSSARSSAPSRAPTWSPPRARPATPASTC